jgi:hypothetical protein
MVCVSVMEGGGVCRTVDEFFLAEDWFGERLIRGSIYRSYQARENCILPGMSKNFPPLVFPLDQNN